MASLYSDDSFDFTISQHAENASIMRPPPPCPPPADPASVVSDPASWEGIAVPPGGREDNNYKEPYRDQAWESGCGGGSGAGHSRTPVPFRKLTHTPVDKVGTVGVDLFLIHSYM